MATLRDIKRKIEAVKKTAQITRAMNMVAVARLRGAQQGLGSFRAYAQKFRDLVGRLTVGIEGDADIDLLKPRAAIRQVALVALSADRGLCGGFNNNLIAAAERFCKEKRAAGITVVLTSVGRKGSDYFRRTKHALGSSHTGLLHKPNYGDASCIGQALLEQFADQSCDEAYIIYSKFVSVAKHVPTLLKLLPIEAQWDTPVTPTDTIDYLFEPAQADLLADLLPSYIYVQILECLYQTAVSEHAARMAAMENATNNCNDMATDLSLIYNKARQASITKELMDIVGGSEALR